MNRVQRRWWASEDAHQLYWGSGKGMRSDRLYALFGLRPSHTGRTGALRARAFAKGWRAWRRGNGRGLRVRLAAGTAAVMPATAKTAVDPFVEIVQWGVAGRRVPPRPEGRGTSASRGGGM